jgi:hypothetical protein
MPRRKQRLISGTEEPEGKLNAWANEDAADACLTGQSQTRFVAITDA